MILGFTGTRQGLTDHQTSALEIVLSTLHEGSDSHIDSVFHHGDCVGADYGADAIARTLGWKIGVHPPSDERMRAFVKVDHRTTVYPAKPFLRRNEDIVRAADRMIACPRQDRAHEPPVGSRGEGTWACVNAARRAGVPVSIIWPDGTVELR